MPKNVFTSSSIYPPTQQEPNANDSAIRLINSSFAGVNPLKIKGFK